MYTITKQFEFEAMHRLRGLPEGHKCGRDHGHSYVLEVELKSERLDAHGFVQDYGELKPIRAFVDDCLDHRDLNGEDVVRALQLSQPMAWQPSAENLCRALYERFRYQFPLIVAVRMSETRKTWAEWRPRELTEEERQERATAIKLGELAMYESPRP